MKFGIFSTSQKSINKAAFKLYTLAKYQYIKTHIRSDIFKLHFDIQVITLLFRPQNYEVKKKSYISIICSQ